MCDDFIHPGLVTDSRLSRRSFAAMTVATAGISGTALAQSNVVEKDVAVKTAAGNDDAIRAIRVMLQKLVDAIVSAGADARVREQVEMAGVSA